MKSVQAYIGLRGNPNVSELADVPVDKQKFYEQTVWKKVHRDIRIKKTRWVVLRWPTPSMAQMAEMCTEAFEDFYFNVCTLDYAKMSPGHADAQDAHAARPTGSTSRARATPTWPSPSRASPPSPATGT